MGEDVENGVTQQGLLVDIEETSRASEELLVWEPVLWNTKWRLAVWEFKNLGTLSWATVVITMFNFMLNLITLMFVGHFGALALAGASITNAGIRALAFGIMVISLLFYLYF